LNFGGTDIEPRKRIQGCGLLIASRETQNFSINFPKHDCEMYSRNTQPRHEDGGNLSTFVYLRKYPWSQSIYLWKPSSRSNSPSFYPCGKTLYGYQGISRNSKKWIPFSLIPAWLQEGWNDTELRETIWAIISRNRRSYSHSIPAFSNWQ